MREEHRTDCECIDFGVTSQFIWHTREKRNEKEKKKKRWKNLFPIEIDVCVWHNYTLPLNGRRRMRAIVLQCSIELICFHFQIRRSQ